MSRRYGRNQKRKAREEIASRDRHIALLIKGGEVIRAEVEQQRRELDWIMRAIAGHNVIESMLVDRARMSGGPGILPHPLLGPPISMKQFDSLMREEVDRLYHLEPAELTSELRITVEHSELAQRSSVLMTYEHAHETDNAVAAWAISDMALATCGFDEQHIHDIVCRMLALLRKQAFPGAMRRIEERSRAR